MVEIGKMAPDFQAQASNGKSIALSDFLGKKVVLYFYPKDNTAGCTAEACDFRDQYSNFENAGAVIIGVSKDPIGSHHKFIEKYGLPFILVSDPELSVLKQYGVWQEKKLYGKTSMGVVRTTVLVDENGIVRKIYPKVKVKGHVEIVLKDLQDL